MKSTKSKTIGDLINEEVRRKGMPVTKFAKEINCQRNNVYDIFNRSNMDIDLLKRISKVLGANFSRKLQMIWIWFARRLTMLISRNKKPYHSFLMLYQSCLKKWGKTLPYSWGILAHRI